MSDQLIGKYRVIETLGQGSMGVVYKAEDPEIGRLVAIKTLRSVYMGDDSRGNEALARFRQEARSAGKLRHPHIVMIFEAGKTSNGSPYIVMDFIEGTSLDKLIGKDKKLPPKDAIHYLAQIASAIDYAHAQSIIHRDIKPSNVIIDNSRKAHLLDFGVAKLADTSLTPAGTVVGTPSYMSPEQIRGEQLNAAADIFSFAVMVYEALAGVRPFPGKDFTTVVTNIIHNPPLRLFEVGYEGPKEVQQVLDKALSKDRTQRFTNALEFIDKLGKIFSLAIDGSGVIGEATLLPPVSRASGMPGAQPPQDIAVDMTLPLSAPEIRGTMVNLGISPPELAEVKPLESKPSANKPSEIKAPQTTPEASNSNQATATNNKVVDPKVTTENAADKKPAAQSTTTKVATENQPEKQAEKQIPKQSEKPKQRFEPLQPIVTERSEDLPPASPAQQNKVPAKSGSIFIPGLIALCLLGGGGLYYALNQKHATEEETASSSADHSEDSNFTLNEETKVKTPAAETTSTLATTQATTAVTTPTEKPSSATGERSLVELLMLNLTADVAAKLSNNELKILMLGSDLADDVTKLLITELAKRKLSDVSGYIGSIMKHKSFQIRIEALKALAVQPNLTQDQAAISLLSDRLSDPDYLVRGFAAKVIGKSKISQARTALETQLQTEENDTVRQVMSAALESISTT
ncbi:protein kinase [bacterium]|nr:protein kinase [bacterium]